MIRLPPGVDSAANQTTGWFRSPTVWQHLTAYVNDRGGCDFWMGACATGEEAYSAAILLEALNLPGTVYASDVSSEAVTIARTGRYDIDHVDDYMNRQSRLPSILRKLTAAAMRQQGDQYVVHERVRRRVRFTVRDLRTSPPPRADVAVVANCWRFFDAAQQSHLLAAIHDALPAHGRLVIGPADLYSPHLRNHRPPALRRYFRPAEYDLIFQPLPGPTPARTPCD